MNTYYHNNMRMHISILLFLLLVFITCLFFTLNKLEANVIQYPQLTLYRCYTNEQLTVGWNNPNNLLTEFYFWNIGEEKKYISGSTTAALINFKLPRTGLYSFYARFKLPDNSYTEWTNSIDSQFCQIIPIGQTGYISGAWVLYGHISPPSGGGIERGTK